MQITFTPILLGVLVAFGMRSEVVWRMLAMLPRWVLGVTCVLAIAFANVPGDIRGWPRLAFHLAIALTIAQVVSRPESPVVRVLEWRPLAFVGAVSYGVYLLHKLVFYVVQRGLAAVDLGSPEALFAMCALGSIGLAALSYRCFEAPILSFKTRFR